MYSPIPNEVLETTIKVYRFYIDVHREAARRCDSLHEAARNMAEAGLAIASLHHIETAANFHRGVVRVTHGFPEEPQA